MNTDPHTIANGLSEAAVEPALLELAHPGWAIIEAERVLYADYGHAVVLCDRLPSPVTLLVKGAALRAASILQQKDQPHEQ